MAADVEKAAPESEDREAPKAERATRGAATRRPRGDWKRSCLVAVRRVRLTADIVDVGEMSGIDLSSSY